MTNKKKVGLDDFVKATGATREDLEKLDRIDPAAIDGAPERGISALLAHLIALGDSPAPEAVEQALRTVAAGVQHGDGLRRSMVRESAIQVLAKWEISAPARLVDAALESVTKDDAEQTGTGRRIVLSDADPWSDPVDGTALLDDVAATFRHYVALPDHADTALALFAAHTHAIEATDIAPILALTSPLPRCGKTTVLTLQFGLTRRPLPASNTTGPALFRAVERYAPTLLVDEADAFLHESDELRGIINSGHTRPMAYVLRTVGDDHEPRLFCTFCSKLIALIGRLPLTLRDRSIEVRMRRRTRGERVERLRLTDLPMLEPLRRRLARWVNDHLAELRGADPSVPPELDDRAADNWRPLLAIADVVGGKWPELARTAARFLSAGAREETHEAAELLADLQKAFQGEHTNRLPSVTFVEWLIQLEDRPWAERNRGKPITQSQVATLLREFDIRPKAFRIGTSILRGYELDNCEDAFVRYLGAEPLQSQQPRPDADSGSLEDRNKPAPVAPSPQSPNPVQERLVTPVAGREREEREPQHPEACDCPGCVPPDTETEWTP